MEGRDGAHPFDLVDMATRLRERLAEQRSRRSFAKQKQPLRLGKANVPPSDLGALLAVLVAEPSTRRMDRRKRSAIRLRRIDADRGKHARRKRPAFAANRLSRSIILKR